MKNLLTKIAAPVLLGVTLFFAQPQKAECETEKGVSGFKAGVNYFLPSDSDIQNAYGGMWGVKLGLNNQLDDNVRLSTNLSLSGTDGKSRTYGSTKVDSEVSIVHFEPMIQFFELDRKNSALFYGGAGLSYSYVKETITASSNVIQEIEMTAYAWGAVFSAGFDIIPEKENVNLFGEISYRFAKKNGVDFGGFALNFGVNILF